MHRRSICFLLSDFQDEGYERALAIAKRRHDMVCIQLHDPAETAFPNAGWLQWRDPETGELHWVNSSRGAFRKKFEDLSAELLSKPQRTFQSMGVDSVLIDQSKDYIQPLLQFFRFREKRQ
jgi:hypothetical protein